MVLLSAKNTDENINRVTPEFFKKFPDMAALSTASYSEMEALLSKVRFHRQKIEWLQDISTELKSDENIPKTMKGLTDLKGIGRKSANVILRESGEPAEGILVDLHVLRVVDRLGISHAADGIKMEKDLMKVLPKEIWGEVGMAISFLGRDTCRPTNPHHSECLMNKVCDYCVSKSLTSKSLT